MGDAKAGFYPAALREDSAQCESRCVSPDSSCTSQAMTGTSESEDDKHIAGVKNADSMEYLSSSSSEDGNASDDDEGGVKASGSNENHDTVSGDIHLSADKDEAAELFCEPCGEEAPIKRARIPDEPTREERERHWATHLPYRSWCPVCVKASGREDPHRTNTGKSMEESIDSVAMDYAEVGNENSEGAKTAYKFLIGRDRKTKYTFAHMVSKKGTTDEKIVGKVLRSPMETGNTRIELKTDGEPALIQVQEAVINQRQHPTIPVNPPAPDPQSNGEAERAVQEVKAQLRSTKLGLEARVQQRVNDELPVLEWMIPHATNIINKFLVGADGRTAYQRIHLKEFKGKVFEFGEQVLASLPELMEAAARGGKALRLQTPIKRQSPFPVPEEGPTMSHRWTFV